MSKVIFLDIDGPIMAPRSVVLHRMAKNLKTPLHGFTKAFFDAAQEEFHLPDPVAVILITKLAEDTGAKIVISSTWRGHGQRFIDEDLPMLGFDKSLLHEDWATPYLKGKKARREEEIKAWLEKHPDVKQFITFDDEVLDFDTHIQVCGENGFLIDNYHHAMEIFTGKISKQTSLYTTATPDFLGPPEILEDSPRLKRAIERVRERRDKISRRFREPN